MKPQAPSLFVISCLMLSLSCAPEKTEPSKTCVNVQGHKMPCETVDLTKRPAKEAAEAVESPKEAVETPEEAQARVARVRRLELEVGAGATTCDEIAQVYASLGLNSPACERARDCVWADYEPLSCGTAIHRRSNYRKSALEELDRLLECERPALVCESNREDLVLTCQKERCVPAHIDNVPPPEAPKRLAELQRITGAQTCRALNIHFAALQSHGPRCKRDRDCVFYDGSITLCGVALHVDSIPRAEALDELGGYLDCMRSKARCRYRRDDYAITCDEGQCQKEPLP